MEDIILITAVLLLFGAGFIPVILFSRFMNRTRRIVIDGTRRPPRREKLRGGEGHDPVSEFDRDGEYVFDGTENENKDLE